MSGNPYEDTPMNPDDANESLLAELRGNIAKGGDEPEETNDDDMVVVGAPVEEEPDDGDPDETPRQRKRRERGERWREEQSAKKDEAAQLREELAEARGQLTAMQSQRVAQQPANTDRRSEFDNRRDTVKAARSETLAAYRVALETAQREKRELTKEEQESWLDRNDRNTREMNRIDYDEHDAEKDTPQERARAGLVARHPDVMGNPKYAAYARNLYEQASARGEVTGTNEAEIEEKVIAQTRREMRVPGYKKSQPATDKDKSTYGNVGGTGDRSSKRQKTVNVPENSPEWQMAMGLSRHRTDWTEPQKVQHWVNTVGRELKGG